MENSMVVFKKWINILIYFFVVLLCSCNANKFVPTQEKENIILEITFDEYFDNDKVGLLLNNQMLVEEKMISNSKLFSGPTNLSFIIFKEGKKFYATKELRKFYTKNSK